MKILILAALLERLRLDKEIREIEDAIKRAVKRDLFEIKIRTAVRPQDIRRALAEEEPSIVHFCCHGMEDGSLVLEDNGGNHKAVFPAGLAALFELHTKYVKCVLLNACYSFKPAEAVSQHINYVIGMNQSIQDEAAIVFAQGFYDGLGYDNIDNIDVIQRAFNEGIVAIKLENLLQSAVPSLWGNGILYSRLKQQQQEAQRRQQQLEQELESRQQQPTPSDDLSSARGVDYTGLRDLLKARRWKEADYETYLVMLQAVGRSKGDWIRDEELLNFPYTDLRTIDRLWVKYSNERFGLSVQKQIYLEVGGLPDGKYYKEAWEKFGDAIGWRVKKSWIKNSQVTFNTNASQGHLPVYCAIHEDVTLPNFVFEHCHLASRTYVLFSRVETCKE